MQKRSPRKHERQRSKLAPQSLHITENTVPPRVLHRGLDSVDDVVTKIAARRCEPNTVVPAGLLGGLNAGRSAYVDAVRSRCTISSRGAARNRPDVRGHPALVMLEAPRFPMRVSNVNARMIVVFVAKEGPYQGRVLSAIVPDAAQTAQWGL
jgi:hypothetical protein